MGFTKARANAVQAAKAAQAAQLKRRDTTDNEKDVEQEHRPSRWLTPLLFFTSAIRFASTKVRQCINPHATEERVMFELEKAILTSTSKAPVIQMGVNAALAERLRREDVCSYSGMEGPTSASKVRAFQQNADRPVPSLQSSPASSMALPGAGSRVPTMDGHTSSRRGSRECGRFPPVSPVTAGVSPSRARRNSALTSPERDQSPKKSSGKKSSKVAPSPLPSPPASRVPEQSLSVLVAKDSGRKQRDSESERTMSTTRTRLNTSAASMATLASPTSSASFVTVPSAGSLVHGMQAGSGGRSKRARPQLAVHTPLPESSTSEQRLQSTRRDEKRLQVW